MKRRLRKKFHLGEFREFGFAVEFALDPGLSDDEAGAFLDRFIVHAVEADRMVAGGGGHGTRWNFFVSAAARRGSVDEAQRARVLDWLGRQPEVKERSAGPLVDAWHDLA
jgi:uncharacterized protein YggL (DUF469 family)